MNFFAKTLLDAEQWQSFVHGVKCSKLDTQNVWYPLFGSFGTGAQSFMIGQLGQSLDGRIATPTGDSKYINGEAGLTHLHRLRALVDAVIVGVGTAVADDPMLTVRKVPGTHPARVVIDPTGKLSRDAKVWCADGTRRLVVTNEGAKPDIPAGVEHVALTSKQGQITPVDIISALANRGLHRILIEGGADTIARFIHAGCLHRLHLIVAPVILGSGRTGLCLAEIQKLSEAIRPVVSVHPLDGEVLFDCDFSG
ncbi:riboflavin-specific deaminase-like protein [Jezberella montanilacus]|jgi:riboflavin-specific deaminase-like protein|uniref:Riboflavin-specific deaminase-like protein n=1 Tax=Jezberella montanilacus TaxID=323426 RepID=A0A2T0XET4_9BURK|nr:RibD family protein [Jezberella montanilacus]PRY97458.1 riboflavin-specific deaminase-like protein [Jezberella montanilacus]